MNQREVFLEKALKVHREFELATIAMRQMMQENKASGPEWEAADARKRAALIEWSSLSRHLHEIYPAE